jgi:hypothetical protein
MQQHLAAQGGGDAGEAADGARVLEVLQDDVARMRVQVRVVCCLLLPRLWVADALQRSSPLTAVSRYAAVRVWGCSTLSSHNAT